MIDDLDATLKEFVLDGLGRPRNLALSFAAPDSNFPPSGVELPALDLFLYDIRENLELRSNEPVVAERDGRYFGTRASPRIDCSYLITAWPSDASPMPMTEEHQLLGEVLQVLLQHRQLPESVLQGKLAGQDRPVRARATRDSYLQSLGEFWQAMGGKPKASIHFTVTVSMGIFAEQDIGAPATDLQFNLTQGAESANVANDVGTLDRT